MKGVKISRVLWGIVSLAVLSACSGKDNGADAAKGPKQEDEVRKVKVENVGLTNVDQLATFTATVEAFKTNNIAPSSPNRIKRILVDVGSKVAKGQTVAVMDDATIDQVKVQMDQCEREYNRAAKLLQIGSGTQQAVDQQKAQLDALRRQYSNLVENTMLVSPISGVVTARNYDPGDMTSTLPILTIEQVKPVKLILNVSEQDYSKVKKGMPVDITLDTYPGEEFKGEVYLIYPTVDAATRTFTVEVTINNGDDRVVPGMFARATMNFGTASHVVVPDRAIVKMPGSGNKYVYVYDPKSGTVSYNKVELGQRIGNSYEVLSGIPDSCEVVTNGQVKLADGVKVEVIK